MIYCSKLVYTKFSNSKNSIIFVLNLKAICYDKNNCGSKP